MKSYAGISRSATIVIAYLMWKEKKSFKQVLNLVKDKRVVRPNRGFFRQLQLFELMGNQVSKDSAIYKTFKLENLADQVKKAWSKKNSKSEKLLGTSDAHLKTDSSIQSAYQPRRPTILSQESNGLVVEPVLNVAVDPGSRLRLRSKCQRTQVRVSS